ncbi:amino acid adenylation domain-containing protein [Kitasatospora purpeofusca]|uniref:amino acid adenylation domain-containing protein n=1 Tax=Kitasatospora purpeofusca TaxID=67352 RepID=UPI0035DF3CCA
MAEPQTPTTLTDLVEEQVRRTPDAVAVEDGLEALDYRGLWELAGAIGGGLVARGVRPGEVVAVLMPRGAVLVAAVLGVLRAGGAYLAVDPDQPAERVRGMLADAGVRQVVVSGPPPTGALPEGIGLTDLGHRRPGAAPPAEGPDRPLPAVGPGHAAYAVFTSGSTGRPKGVLNEHGAIARKVGWLARTVPLGPDDTVLHKTAYAFDYSVCELFWPLVCGARLLVVPSGAHGDPVRLVGMMREHRVTVAQFVPSMLEVLMEDRRFARLDALRVLVVGGEALPEPLLARLREHSTAIVVNPYGPAECSVFATCWVSRAGDGRPVTIGPAVAGSRLSVRDGDGHEVAPGEDGELWIGGPGVGRGYLGRPELTARAFLPDPDAPGGRLYRTGDLVRLRPDGEYDYVGRIDDQVKIHGQRIEPGEVRRLLLAATGASRAAVLPFLDPLGDRALAAFLVPGERPRPAPAELRALLAARLPAAMIPSAIEWLDALPVAATGKLDRAALLALVTARPYGPAGPATGQDAGRDAGQDPRPDPGRDVGTAVAALWGELFGRTGIGPDDDFFALGGHSLLAARLLVRLRERFGVVLELRELLAGPTVRELADRVRAAAPVAREAPAGPGLPPGQDVPLAPAQRRMWLLEQLEPGQSAYNVVDVWELEGPVDEPALAHAVRDLLERHDALRTTFRTVDGRPVQHRHAAPANGLEVLPRPLTPAAAEHHLARLARTPFDLGTGPLTRWVLVPTTDGRRLLALVAHHMVLDGWSVEVLWDELSECYRARAAGRTPALPPAPSYAAHSVEAAGRALPAEQLAHWTGRLGDLPAAPDLPVRAATGRPVPVRVRHELPEELARRLDPAARELRCAPAAVLLGCFATVLGAWSDRTDLVLGAPLSGRTTAATGDAVGFFNATVALRLELAEALPETVRRAQRALTEAQMNQDVPYEEVVAAVRAGSGGGPAPLFSVWFNALSFPERGLRLSGATARRAVPPVSGAPFDLTLYVDRRDGRTVLDVVCDAERFDPPWAESLAEQVTDTLRTLLDRPGTGPGTGTGIALGLGPAPVPLAAPRPPDGRSAEQRSLEERIAAHPGDAPAVVDDRGTCDYRELRAAAAAVHEALRRAGLRPGELVRIAAAEGRDLIASILGVWSADAVVLTEDPAQPAPWRDRLVERARPHWTLTHGDGGPVVAPADRAAPLPAERVRRPAGRSATARYVLATSGSTGEPKLVLGAAEPLTAFLADWSHRFGLTARDRFVLLSGRTHDPMLRDLLLPLWNGACVAVPSERTRIAPERMLAALAGFGPTVLHLTPLMGDLLARTAAAGDTVLDRVRLTCFGGDQLSGATVAAWRRTAPAARIVTIYGTTETPQAASAAEVAPDWAGPARTGLGAGAVEARLTVVDRADRPLPVGAVGEIAVRSPLPTLGYLDDEDGTAEVHRPDPWGDPGHSLIRTGDRGRLRWDGTVEFLGRAGGTVKVRGHRVSPAEIARRLREAPGVAHAAVALDAAPGTAPRLVACVVPLPGGTLRPAEVGGWLAGRLPAGHLPDEVVVRPSLPLTANGKLDLPELLRPGRSAPPSGRAPAPAARTGGTARVRLGGKEFEQRLARIWGRVLERPEVGPDDNFFDLGGDSAGALRLAAELRSELGLDVAPLTVFTESTVRRMAAGLAPAEAGADRADRADGSAAPDPVPTGLSARELRRAARAGGGRR